jgi:hypothetical protein
MSLIVTAFITIMHIPMVIVYLQGFMCDEDPDDIYVIDITCASSEHYLMIGLSTITLIPYLVLLFVERIIFTSRSFESQVPWASLEPHLDIWKICVKIIVATSWVFDKYGRSQGYVHLLIGFTLGLILYRRIRTGVIVNRQVYFTTIIMEASLTWLYIITGALILSKEQQSISSTAIVLAIGLIIGGILIVVTERTRFNLLINDTRVRDILLKNNGRAFSQTQDSQEARSIELYLYRIFELIASNDPMDRVLL